MKKNLVYSNTLFPRQKNVLSKKNTASRKLSSINALFKPTLEIQKSWGMKNTAKIATILDLRKAFDTVSHKHLLNVHIDLASDGQNKNSCLPIYQTEVKVRIGNQLPSWKTTGVDVPQGSALGTTYNFIYK